MTHWSEGYVSDIDYTHGYYEELNPARLTIPFLMAGLAPPDVKHACELGFGQGVSVNLHAAASDTAWHATDFNPSQAHFAQHLASLSGVDSTRLHISDQGFNEFCAREDLPEFDFIALHGIWSWISDDNRHIITDFLRRKLKVGGVLYISYNTLPGWSAMSPIRHLLTQHNAIMASGAQNRASNARDAVNFGKDVLSLSRYMTSATPSLIERIDNLVDMSPNYLAHEYLNKDWHPMYFAQIEEWLSSAKLSYGCSSHFLDDFAPVLFDDEQKAFFENIANPSLAQTIKDYLLNKQFRRDYWIKGARRLSHTERANRFKEQSVLLAVARDKFELTVKNHRSTQVLPELFDPVLDVLADGQIHSVASLCETLKDAMPEDRVFLVLAILYGKGDLVWCNSDISKETKAHCQAFNHAILNDTRPDQEVVHLASPVTGGGVHFSYIERLFLWAHLHGHASDAWIEQVWQVLKSHRQLLIKDGETLQGDEANLAEIARIKDLFSEHRFGLAQRLQVV